MFLKNYGMWFLGKGDVDGKGREEGVKCPFYRACT